MKYFPLLLPAASRTAAVFALAMACGCATFRTYDAEMSGTLALAARGNIEDAISQLERNNRFGRRDLLYDLELGELQRLNNRYDASVKAWLSADARVQAWEKTALANPERLLGGATSVLLNDKSMSYQPHDYEKVMLTTRLALNHLARGDFATARVDIKRTHERESVIAEMRKKEVRKTEEEANKRGVKTGFKELNGYPVQTIDNAEINALKNSYESAFSHYLAGFVYEALDEPSLAAAGYRHAIELQPQRPQLEEALAGLDARVAQTYDGYTDVLFVIESGSAPARQSRQFSLPFPYRDRLVVVPVSFPVMAPMQPAFMPEYLHVQGEAPIGTTLITSIDLMARKALQEEMPGIVLRGIIRSSSKALAQYQAGKNDQTGLAVLALAVGSIVTESADERGWRSLPAQIAIARARIASGEHTIGLGASGGGRSVRFSVTGRHAVVALRFLGANTLTMLPRNLAAPQSAGPQRRGTIGASTPRVAGTFYDEATLLRE